MITPGQLTLRLQMMRLGCSSTGSERINAATSSAVFHFASCDRRFWPAQTLVWMILRKSWPVRGLKMKMAPLMGLVVRLPSKVCRDGEVAGWARAEPRGSLLQASPATLPPAQQMRPNYVLLTLWMVTRYTLVSSTNLRHKQTRHVGLFACS